MQPAPNARVLTITQLSMHPHLHEQEVVFGAGVEAVPEMESKGGGSQTHCLDSKEIVVLMPVVLIQWCPKYLLK